jgi:hypothetical protein
LGVAQQAIADNAFVQDREFGTFPTSFLESLGKHVGPTGVGVH